MVGLFRVVLVGCVVILSVFDMMFVLGLDEFIVWLQDVVVDQGKVNDFCFDVKEFRVDCVQEFIEEGKIMIDSIKFVMLIIGDVFYDLLIYLLIVGFDVFDICKFYGQVGVFIYDSGFIFIVFCDFIIIYIDGGKGELLYCGYLID